MDYKHNLVFKSNKKELQMNENSDIHVIDIQGIEASSYTINKVNSEQDGATPTSVRIEPREITITGDIEKNNKEDKNREFLLRFFNPKQDGTMYITRNNISRKIQYKVSSFDFATNKMYEYIDFTVVLECIEDPYFSDAKNSGNYLTLISPQFTFPLAIFPNKIMGYKRYKPVMPLVNDGDEETGIEIIVIAKRGKMKNIKLTLNDKEYMKVNIEMKQWDTLKNLLQSY